MSRLHYRMSAAVAAAMVVVAAGTAPAAQAHPVDDKPCADVEVVFARGSGEKTKEAEATTFFTKLSERIGSALSVNPYELGSEALYSPLADGKIEVDQYPAVPISGDPLKDPIGTAIGWNNAIYAKVSSGGAFAYGLSVNAGVAELSNYLSRRAAKCPGSHFVLGGYSQGAQVIGETYVEKLDDRLRSRIVYNALFGDPKTYLPEGSPWRGFGMAKIPDACSGAASPWRAYVPSCYTWQGSLNARDPYLPASWTKSTGLWCRSGDPICGSGDANWLTTIDSHGKYVDGGQIDDAVRTIAQRLASLVPKDKSGDISTVVNGGGAAHQNTLFMIDATGSMSGRIAAARQFAADQMDGIIARGGKVALAQYRDSVDTEPVKVLSDFTNDASAIKSQLDTIYADGGGDEPEGLLHGLYTSFNALHWENGAAKAAVVLTDAGFHNPDLTAESDGRHVGLKDIVDLALRIDPVNVYPVVPSYIAGDYQAIADQTSGKVIVDSGDSSAALTSAMTSLDARPVASLAMSSYASGVGEPITFDASSSCGLNGATLTKYEWDTNGDGVFDVTTDGPVLKYTYPAAFDGVMQVRVTDSNGGVGSASATVQVGGAIPQPVQPPAGLTATVESTTGTTSTVKLAWSSTDPKAAWWGIAVNGVPLGRVDGASRSIEITEVQRGAAVDFGVLGLTADGHPGVPAVTTLAAMAPSGPTPPAAPPSQPPTGGPVSTGPVNTGPAPVAPAPSQVIPTVHLAAAPAAPVAQGWLPNQNPGQGILQAQIQPSQPPTPSASPAAAPAPSSSSAPPPAQANAATPDAAAPAGGQPPAKDASPAADFGPLPWILGGIVLVAAAALAVVAARRRSRGL